jgi:hypothetical protein
MSNTSIETTLNECMLSTKDNPYNPFENFDEWYRYDMDQGWDSSGRLARIAKLSDDMSDEEVDLETERAIDEIIKHDFLNIFIKVRPNSTIEPEKIETEPS